MTGRLSILQTTQSFAASCGRASVASLDRRLSSPQVASTKIIVVLLRNLAMGPTIADITFTRVLKESDSSTIFQVTVEGENRVLKVVCYQ